MKFARLLFAALALVFASAAHAQTLGTTTTGGGNWATVLAPDINDDWTKVYGTPVLTIGNQTTWSDDRAFTAGTCITGTDAGAGSTYTVAITAACISATQLGTDSVSADELNATGVESELEAVLDLADLQGSLTLAGDVDGAHGSNDLDEAAVETELEGVLDVADLQGFSAVLTEAEAAAAYQPLDSDLTSWAGVTRASGYDTFAATPTMANLGSLLSNDASGWTTFGTTPSSANLATLVTDETGSGALVFGTDPDISISATTEGNIEAAIDTLGNLASVQGFAFDLDDNNLDELWGWDDSAATFDNFSLADITTEAAPASGDFVLIYGAEGDLRKVDWDDLPAGSGVSDGDKGDITVSGSGTVWEIDADTITTTELADNAVALANIGDDAVGINELDLVDGDVPDNGDCLTYDTGAGGSIEAIPCPGAGGGISNVSEDADPELGGNLGGGTDFSIGEAADPTGSHFLVAASTIDWGNGDVVITHSANDLAFTGVTGDYSFDDTVGVTGSVTASVDVTATAGDVTSGDDVIVGDDVLIATLGVINFGSGEVTITETDANTLTVAGTTANNFSGTVTAATDLIATAGDVTSGDDVISGDDVLLSDAGVVNFGAGDCTLTDGTNMLTMDGCDLTTEVVIPDGDNTRDLGSTGATWATAHINAIELANGTANTLTASGGNASIEGNVVYRAGGTNVAIVDGGCNADDAATCFSNIKQAASETATGVVELATTGEAETGTDTSRAVTAAGVLAAVTGKKPIWIPGGSLVPRTTNGCAVTDLELGTNDIMLRTCNYDTTTEEGAGFTIRMPDTWNEGTLTVVPVWAHPATVTNFGVVWGFSCLATSNDDAMDAALGTQVTSTDTGGTTSDQYTGPETSAMTCSGSPAAGDTIYIEAERLPGNGSDTLAVDAYLLGFTVYYTDNAFVEP